MDGSTRESGGGAAPRAASRGAGNVGRHDARPDRGNRAQDPAGAALPIGLGKSAIAFVLSAAVNGHIYCHAGEIAALEGTRGLKGYPY